MPSVLATAYALVALLGAGEPATSPSGARLAAPPDSATEAVIVDEVRAFYRDLDGGNWTALLDHFLPAKVTARWAPPVASAGWAGLHAPPPTAAGAAGASRGCAPRAAVAIVGDWARVRIRRCADPADEAWLLRVSGRWKIVHLALATRPAV